MINRHTITQVGIPGFIEIESELFVPKGQKSINFSVWRPGRYEAANFAKYVYNLNAYTTDGERLTLVKTDKNVWSWEGTQPDKIIVRFRFFCTELNAGSTYSDDGYFYINPINCLPFISHCEDAVQIVRVNIKTFRTLAGRNDLKILGLGNNYKLNDGDLECRFEDLHALFDSPFVITVPEKVVRESYVLGGIKYWVSFVCEDIDEFHTSINHYHGSLSGLIEKYRSFSKTILELFGSVPFKEYEFINFITTYAVHHGVEHLSSTVIVLGSALSGERPRIESLDDELLDISAHELFHAWNVKTIRPLDMLPYDYRREMPSVMHYVTEGITTYYGSFMVFRSIRDKALENYIAKLEKTVTRFIYNPATEWQSLRDSSLDSWLDGYQSINPSHRISFYNEGSMWALIVDATIRRHTSNEFSLDDVMRSLYYDYALEGSGYNAEILEGIIAELTDGETARALLQLTESPAADLLPNFKESLEYFGLKLSIQSSNPYNEAGIYSIDYKIGGTRIAEVEENSLAAQNGYRPGDLIISATEAAEEANSTDNPVVKDYTVSRQNRVLANFLPPLDLKCEPENVKITKPEQEDSAAYTGWKTGKAVVAVD